MVARHAKRAKPDKYQKTDNLIRERMRILIKEKWPGTQRTLGRQFFNMEPKEFNNVLMGRHMPRPGFIVDFCRVFGVTPNELMWCEVNDNDDGRKVNEVEGS